MNKFRRSLLSIIANNEKIKFVSFLVGTGNQYMKTGLTGGQYIIEFGAQATNITSNGVLPIGAGNSYYIFFNTTTTTAFKTSTFQQQSTQNTPLEFHTYKTDGYSLYIDDVKKITLGIANNTGELWLFKSYSYADRPSTLKMSYCKIYDMNTNELIRDYKPAIDENGRAGMYDAVANTFTYSNVGEFEYEEW